MSYFSLLVFYVFSFTPTFPPQSNPCTSGFLSPPTSASRRPSVMFNEYVLLHTPPAISEPLTIPSTTTTNVAQKSGTVCSSEKMTQAGDGSIWQVSRKQMEGGKFAFPTLFHNTIVGFVYFMNISRVLSPLALFLDFTH